MPRLRAHLADLLIGLLLIAGAAVPWDSRAFQVLVLAAMLGALWQTGARLAQWLVPDFEPLSRAVAAFTFAVGIAIVPATWMGHFGVLRPAPFLVWTAAVLLLSRFLPRKRETTGTNPAPACTASGVPSRSSRIETGLIFTAVLAIALLALREVHGLRYAPPGPYDDLSYHLSAVATWIRHGDLRMIRFSMGDPSTPFYPILGEMASWVLIAPFRDSDVAARWTQLPFALFSILAVAAIARRLGLTRRDAALAAISYAGIRHVFPFLALSAGNDHSVSFFTLATLDGALALARYPRRGEAIVTGAALGLLLATKYVGVLFAPVLVAVLILAGLAGRRRGEERTPVRVVAGLALLLTTTVALTGGYTYLRNAAITGNPLFPVPVRILGIEIFPGWGGVLASERATSPEFQIDVWHFLTRRSRLFGSYFPFTLLPATLLTPLLALGRRQWREALVFSLPAVVFLQFLFLMPNHQDIRFILPGIAVAAVAFAWSLAQFGPRAFAIRAALLLWIAWQAVRQFDWSNGRRVLATLALLGAGALAEIAWRRWRQREEVHPRLSSIEPWTGAAAAGLLALAALPLGRMVASYQEVKLAEQPAPLALERLAGPDGARIAYTGFNKPYLFFGSRLQNGLEIVPRNRALDARTYRWGNRRAEPWGTGRYRPWRRNLERLGIDFVVLMKTQWADPEQRWIRRGADGFQKVYEDAETEIWRVFPEGVNSGRRTPY